MNDLMIFNNEEFGDIRTVAIDGEPWFVGKDVAEALGYSNARDALAKHVDLEDKGVAKCDTLGGKQDLAIINESGLYALVFGSKLDSAKRFKRWVTSEVLPAIRKNGIYGKPMTAMELLELQMKATKEVSQRVDSVNDDLQSFKRDMPILGIEESRITGAVRKRGVQCLGGKESAAYQDKSLRSRVYSDIYGQLKREFGIGSYKAIKRSQCDVAVGMIETYELPYVLAEEIKDCNAQMAIFEPA